MNEKNLILINNLFGILKRKSFTERLTCYFNSKIERNFENGLLLLTHFVGSFENLSDSWGKNEYVGLISVRYCLWVE